MIDLDVLIVYEHVVRELESALLLEKRLKEKKLKVKVVQAAWTEHSARLLYRPKVIVVPWCYDEMDFNHYCGYVGGYRNRGIKLINLHCEQIGDASDDEFMLPTGSAKETFHFAWGNDFYDKLVKSGTDPKKIIIAGSPRLDLFREEFRYISLSKKNLADRFEITSDKKWVLVIGNFDGDALRGRDTSHLEERGCKGMAELAETMRNSYREILDWLEKACKNPAVSEQYEVIYRPHPSENITDQIKELEKKYKNFHVHKEYAIRDWMINCDLLFAWNSTSAVEAAYSGKPIYFLRPIEMPAPFRVELLEHVEKLTDADEFVNCLVNFDDDESKDINLQFKKEISRYFYSSDKSSIEHMALAIEEILSSEEDTLRGTGDIWKRTYLFVSHYVKRILKAMGILERMARSDVFYADVPSKKTYMAYWNRINCVEEINES